MTLIDICSYAVKEALKQDADEAEAYAALDKEAEVFLENSDLKQVKSHRKSSIGVRVFVNNSLGFASVNSLEKEKVLDAVSKAVKIARASPRDKHNFIPFKRMACPLSPLARGERTRTGELFEHLNRLDVAGHLIDDFYQLFRHQRRSIIGNDLLEFRVEIGIFINFAHRLFEDLHPVLGRSWR